jgi:hypothetical protein
MALGLGGFLGQDMTQVGMRALELAITERFKALGGTALGFHLRHLKNSALINCKRVSAKQKNLLFSSPPEGGLKLQGLWRFLLRSQDHHHLPPFHLRELLHLAKFSQIGFQPFQLAQADLLVRHFPTAEP